jgi:hypothetical protein
MKKSILKRIAIAIVSITIIAGITEYFWSNHQVKTHKGGYVEVIDPTSFVDTFEQIGIKNVNILSHDSQSFILKNIVLKNGIIEAITSVDSLDINVQYIDGTGQFLIPGLVDTHVHLSQSKNDLYLYLANGVTSICEMFGTKEHLQWRKEAKEGAISPNMYVATTKLGSQEGFNASMSKYYGGAIHITSASKARKAIRKFKKEGYDAIKLGSLLNQEIYNAITDEAKQLQIPTIGHLPYQVGLKNLYQSEQSHLAHVEEIAKATMKDFGGLNSSNTEEYIDYLKKNIDNIAIKLREKNISVSTTVWLMESLPKQAFNLEEFIKTVELEYANSGIIEGSSISKGWLLGHNEYENLEAKNNPKRKVKWNAYYKTYIEAIHIVTKALIANNAILLTGTDTNVPGIVPGFSIHDEMNSLSNLGMSNAQILHASTQAPADFMKTNTGKIAIGYASNLVLLNKNPLDDIKNTKSIASVFFHNYKINKKQIRQILEAVKEANQQSRTIAIEKYLMTN